MIPQLVPKMLPCKFLLLVVHKSRSKQKRDSALNCSISLKLRMLERETACCDRRMKGLEGVTFTPINDVTPCPLLGNKETKNSEKRCDRCIDCCIKITEKFAIEQFSLVIWRTWHKLLYRNNIHVISNSNFVPITKYFQMKIFHVMRPWGSI